MRRFKKATLTDVAQRAGVSVTTASYILNGRSSQMRISAATERRVQAAMNDLDYRPNWSARTLRGSSTQTIGVISDFVASGEFSSRLLSGANAAARRFDHVIVIGETLGNPEVEGLLVEEMLDRQVDGIIYATVAATRVQLPKSLRRGRTVLLNCVDDGADLPKVVPDDVVGGRMAAEHLLAAKVADAVFVVGEDPTPEATAGHDRLVGITRALIGAGKSLAGVVPCVWDVEPAFDAVGAWLDTGPRPSALVCLNDRVAMGAYQALAEHQLRVPEDVSVISFDGSDLATWLRPRVTSLALPFTEMGTRAVEILMDPGWRTIGTTRMPPVLQPGGSV
jgi:LacI family transcriptional regulator, galactose operon repressor